jgi:hypothetical protein
MRNTLLFGLALTLLGAISGYGDKVVKPDLTRIADGHAWKVSNATAESVEMDGKVAARLRATGDSGITGNAGLAWSPGAVFATGIIELDLKGRNQRPSFLGVVFNIINEKTFEGIYFRPFNFKASEPFHGRAVQYIAWPEHTWEELRKNNPSQFEKPINPVPDPDGWFHTRIEVTDNLVRVFVNHGKEPCLTVKRLGEGRVERPVGLFVDCAEGLFANLEVKPAQSGLKESNGNEPRKSPRAQEMQTSQGDTRPDG